MSESKRPTSFAQVELQGNAFQQAMFDILLAGFKPHSRKLVIHLIASTLHRLKRKKGRWVPIGALFIRQHFRYAEIDRLVAVGAIEVRDHDRGAGLSREFRLVDPFMANWLSAVGSAETVARDGVIDVATGRPMNRRLRHRLCGETGNRGPDLPSQAARSITTSWFNARASEDCIEIMKDEGLLLPHGPERDRAERRYEVAATTYGAVLAQRPEPTGIVTAEGDMIYSYPPAYSIQQNGRLSERRGGFQAAPRRLKAAGRHLVPDVLNYDLKEAQLRLAVVLLDEAGIDSSPLTEYLDRPDARAALAAQIGIPPSILKRVLIGLVMGGHAPSPGQLGFCNGKIVRAVRGAVDPADFATVYRRLYDATANLRGRFGEWHCVLPAWAEQNGRRYNKDGGIRVRNDVGSVVSIGSLSSSGNVHELRSKLAAFVLQGKEAAVIHRLCLYQQDYGYTVMSHEHDGLIVRNPIPQIAVERAIQEAGITPSAIVLCEKPIE